MLGVFVAGVTWVAVPEQTTVTRLFVALNICISLRAMTYFIAISESGTPDPAFAPIGTWRWLLFVLMMVGVAGTPTFWFLFAAAEARREDLLSGWPAWLAIAQSVYTVTAGGSNALHRLFAVQSAPGAPVVAGPLAVPHLILSWLFVGWGVWLVTTDLWSRKSREQRIAAVLIVVAAVVVVGASVTWAASSLSENPFPIQLGAIVMPVVTATLAWAALRAGLGGVAQLSQTRVHQDLPEPAVAVDDRLIILSMNPSAERIFPRGAIGRRLDDFLPAAAGRANEALVSSSGYRVFQHFHDGRAYWGRATATQVGNTALGCVITLTDITDVPDARRELSRLLGHEEDPPHVSRLSSDIQDLLGSD
jgi:PAS domain-containing protein